MRQSNLLSPQVRILVFLFFSLAPFALWSGTTGKIAGRVSDARAREPLVGANVLIQGTYMGAATDFEGNYFINNVSPGTYTLTISMVGFEKVTVKNVVVKIDLTTTIDAKLNETVIQGQEVIIQAERPLVQKDLTSTSVTVSSDELKRIPTETVAQVINLQAGVVGGHFRGGRSNEVAYLVDGVTVTDPYNGRLSVEIENSSIREMEVISGTFNAEYGQAMSGVVNIVTQEGAPIFHGSLSMYTGDYLTNHADVFPNVGRVDKFRTRNVQMNLSGPSLLLNDLTFFATGRYFNDEGYLYGKRVYNVTDIAPTFPDQNDRTLWVNHNTGDGAYVPMNPYRKYSFNGKLTYSLPELKLSYSAFWDDNWNKYYDHGFAWTPDGIMNHYRTNWVHSVQATLVPSQSTFHTFKLSYNRFDYKGYLYEDPYDKRYVDPNRGTPISNYTFRSGGNQGDRYDRYSNTLIGQWSLTSQISTKHKIGIGVEGRLHEIFSHGMSIVNLTENIFDSLGTPVFTLGYRQLGSFGNQQYLKKPFEFSAYLQDKMEYDIMIINAGVRLDYFDPNSSYPLDLRNPTKNPNFPNAGALQKTKTKVQVSPRLGVSFPITDQGIIHFSYGHFFQIPSFENLYYNSDYLVLPGGSLSSIIGNPDLEAQRTVMYEVGLQQAFFTNISLDFTVYYRDIRNLLGMEIQNTYEGFKYARFVNRDYGNIKGFIISLDRRFADYYGVKLDYTYQIAEGNASDPYATYYNNQTDPPVETNKKVVPLNWDQRSTLNLSFAVGEEGSWNVGMIFQYGAGFPYTEDIRVSNGLRFENGGVKPSTFNLDLRAEKTVSFGGLNFNLFALVYNLLDTKNEYGVDAASGRANVDLYTYLAGPIYGLNTIEEYINNPANFSAPRQVRVGFAVDF